MSRAENAKVANERSKIIVRTSIVGILVNVLLAVFKAAVGLLSNSIAIVLDAVNNLSDALSSVITILGTKLAGKAPDKKHPLGYGRIEYLSAMIVSALVIYAGITAMVESVKKLIHPETPDYSAAALIIVASAIVAKLLLGRYVKKTGVKVNSGSLIASGSDALYDAILSAVVLLSAIIYIAAGVNLEAYVSIAISIFIIKAGIEMLLETIDEILGKRAEAEFTNEIKAFICQEPEVSGAYDLILHSYGPDKYIGSVHIEIPDTMRADEIDTLERRIMGKIYKKYHIIMAGIGIYSVNTTDDRVMAIRTRITRLVMSHEGVLQMHGFYVNSETMTITFDVIIDYAIDNRKEIYEHIYQEVSQEYPEYHLDMAMDVDI
ncbi:MAG: cation transporter [Firmicutes bacterium]|nr:cation transporter [Bacillota bacterium]